MNLGLCQLVNPGTSVGEIDLDATRHERARIHEQVRLRAHLLSLLAHAPIDENLVRVSRFQVVDGESCAELDSAS